MKRRAGRMFLCLLLLNSFLPGQISDAEDEFELRVGIYKTDRTAVMVRKLAPLFFALERAIGENLDRPFKLKRELFDTYGEGLEALVTGSVDFVRFGPASFMLALEKNPKLRLLAMELKGGRKRFPGIIAVPVESELRSLADLKGKSFAFGDRNSTIGRYLGQAELVRAGVRAEDLSRFDYLGRHDLVGLAVARGEYDAGSLKVSTFKHFEEQGKLRRLAQFDCVTRPWVARAGLESELFSAVQKALLEMDSAEALKALRASGFDLGDSDDYELVRNGMELAKAFGG